MGRGRKRRASDLYQVDFVAALFGGFLLIWLAGMSVDTSGASGKPPIDVFEIYGWLEIDGSNAPTQQFPLIPSEALSGCVNSQLVAQGLPRDWSVGSCTAGNVVSRPSVEPTTPLIHWSTWSGCLDNIACLREVSWHTPSSDPWDWFLQDVVNSNRDAIFAGLSGHTIWDDLPVRRLLAKSRHALASQIIVSSGDAGRTSSRVVGFAIAGTPPGASEMSMREENRPSANQLIGIGIVSGEAQPKNVTLLEPITLQSAIVYGNPSAFFSGAKDPPQDVLRYTGNMLRHFGGDASFSSVTIKIVLRSPSWGDSCWTRIFAHKELRMRLMNVDLGKTPC